MLTQFHFTHQCESYHTAGVQAFTMKLKSAVLVGLLCAGASITALAGEQNLPEFDAQYDVYRSGVKIAKTERSFSRMQDGNLMYRSETNVTGLVSMFRQDHIIEESIWQFTDGKPLLNARKNMKEMPASTLQSDAMSKELKRRGFTFVGTTICYAFMQAAGMVNDHLTDCFRYDEITQSTY